MNWRHALMLAVIVLATGQGASAAPAVDQPAPGKSGPTAAELLDGMTRYLAGLQAFTVRFRDGYDVVQKSGQKIEFGESRTVELQRPGRLRVEEISSDGRRDVAVFDGSTISVFDADGDVYAQAPQPGNLDEALYYYVRELRMRMPLALLLTSRLPESLAGRVESVEYVEHTDVLGIPAHHIAGRTGNVDFQFWIRDGAQPWPIRVVITYVNSPGAPQFWADFADWKADPAFGAATFEFSAPASAHRVPFAVQVRPAAATVSPADGQEGSP